MEIRKIAYHGWENCYSLSSDEIQLIVTADVGPRILFFGFRDGENLLYENMDQAGTTGGDTWKAYGGHRFWCSPESIDFTYAPDNFPVEVDLKPASARFIAPVERTGVQKEIEISFLPGINGVQVDHRVINRGDVPLALAPWALTVMRQNGRAIVPHNLQHSARLLPSHCMGIWEYTNLSDPRWTWGDRFIFLDQDPQSPAPQKIGLVNRYGWAAYSVLNQLFIKWFAFNPEAVYPDYQCNFEIYTNDQILELESLGPLQELAPGESTSHQEKWFLHRNIPTIKSEQDVERFVLPLLVD